MFNKQFRIADKGWSSSLCDGWGTNISSALKPACYEMLHRDSEFGRPLWTRKINFRIPKKAGIP